MPVTQSIRACERCGAIVAITSSEGGGVDNEQAHMKFHRIQDELLLLLTQHAQTSLRARLASLLGRWLGKREPEED